MLLLVACEDKARYAYEECVKHEAAGKLDQAEIDCDQAAKLDPNSTSGKAAAAKLAAMQPALTAAKEAYAARTAKAAEERQAKAAAQAAEDSKCRRWVTICTLGQHRDGSEKTTGAQHFDTKAECEGVGGKAGLTCDPCRCQH